MATRPSGTADWLRELCGDGLTGFLPPAMPDAAWVLNARYEHERGPTGTTYHEYRQARLADGTDLEARTVTTGGGLGRAGHPASGGDGCAGGNWPGAPATRSFPAGYRPALLSDTEIEAVRLP
jgi:hypothetical protein